ALKGQPGSANIYCNMGYSLYLQRRWAEAEMNLRQALALEPGHQRARVNLGLVLARAGRWDAALAEFRKGGCSEADAHANLAYSRSLEGPLGQARRPYELALAADPSAAQAAKGLRELDVVIARTGAAIGKDVAAKGRGVPRPSPQHPAAPANPVVLTGAQ